jgi:predicted AlkP superfamily phosphohydrolase/phosphomutase
MEPDDGATDVTSAPSKLLVIGWDGVTFDVIRPMIARSEMPHLARLMAGGAHGPLRSTVPPSSAVAWPTFMTGRDPEGHGLFGFYQTGDGSYQPRLASNRDVHVPCLWDWLGNAGYRVGVVNVPITYPPRPVHGFLVSGMLTPGPEEVFTYPPDLTAQLLAASPPYPIEAQVVKRVRASSSPDEAMDLLQRWTADFQVAARRLLSNQPWDCFVVVYRATDTVQHWLGFQWNPGSAARRPEFAAWAAGGIEAVYRQMDACLGELLALCPEETTVLVVSDHGFGPAFGRFYINNWLKRQGYLVLKRGARYRRRLGGTRRVLLHRALARLGLDALASRLPTRLAEWSIPLPDRRQIDQMVDWRRTRAYVPFSGVQGAVIRLNLSRREPHGAVQPGAEAEALLKELAAQLNAQRDVQGRLLFQDVTIKAPPSTGRVANRGPDLVALPREENYHAVPSKITDDGQVLAGPAPRAGGHHRMHGIFVAHGPAIAPGVALQGARLVDVTPTALHLMGLAVPGELDGRVLLAALRPEWQAAHAAQVTVPQFRAQPSDLADVYSPEEEAAIEDTLRALGYLD